MLMRSKKLSIYEFLFLVFRLWIARGAHVKRPFSHYAYQSFYSLDTLVVYSAVSGRKKHIVNHGLGRFSKAAATEKLNYFMRTIYASDVMLEKSLGLELSKALHYFVRAYLYLAHLANRNGTAHFALYPKLHSLHEISHLLRRQAQLADFVMNPACHSCSLDEDFIGRTACISRTVSPRIIAKRTLERYLVHIQSAWTRVGDGQEGE